MGDLALYHSMKSAVWLKYASVFLFSCLVGINPCRTYQSNATSRGGTVAAILWDTMIFNPTSAPVPAHLRRLSPIANHVPLTVMGS
jgi:hypothetical protein